MRLQLLKFIFAGSLVLSNSLFSQIPLRFQISSSDQSTGYYFLTGAIIRDNGKPASHRFVNIILDNTGQTVYYKRFVNKSRVCDFKILPTGIYSYYTTGKFILMNNRFEIIDSISCVNNVSTDNHELLPLHSGNLAIIGTETVTMDLSSYKVFNKLRSAGSPTALVISGVIQEFDKNKNLVYEWRAKDHFEFMDVDTFYLSDHTKVDWMHINSIDSDVQGNYIVSFRNMNLVAKVSRNNGKVIWLLGGKRSVFRFVNDNGFIGQHDARIQPNGHITLFDNGREQNGIHPAAAKEYRLDKKSLTASLVWKYVPDEKAHSSVGLGNVQYLKNGNRLVNTGCHSGSNSIFSVITPDGKKVFDLTSIDSLRSYRVYNFDRVELPRPAIRKMEKGGKIFLEADAQCSYYRWSSGELRKMIEVTKSGSYKVWVPTPDGGEICSETVEIKLLR